MSGIQGIKCKLFKSHDWEDWQYETAPGAINSITCTMVRHCKHCGFVEYKKGEQHSWTAWAYLRDGDCQQEHICSRCMLKEQRQADHQWAKWAYKPDSCELARECKICHQQEEKKGEHNWTEWTYQADDSCKMARECQRCHKQENRETHTWTDWAVSDNPALLEKHCPRCMLRETKAAHVVPFSHYYGTGVCDVCNRSIESGEAYLVPVSIFYSSSQYREFLAHGPFSFMINLSGMSVDAYIAHARSVDKTAHSAVCPDCVHMFE